MPYRPSIHHRRSIRLPGYDYSIPGLYFITICVQNRYNLFGKIKLGRMFLNDSGKMIENEWIDLSNRFVNIYLHEFIVMPNHFHSIIQITDAGAHGAPLVDAQITPNDDTKIIDDVQNNTQLPFTVVGAPLVGAKITPNDDTKIIDDVQNNTQLPFKAKGQPQGIAPTTSNTVGDIIGAFKSITTVKYIGGVKNMHWQTFNGKLWQRNYYEHIIRNERSYFTIADYIANNPAKWTADGFYNI